MSERIDVLAVMWADAADAAQYRGLYLPERNPKDLLKRSDEARAAVAELIEAAREFHEANENIGDRKAGNAHERLKRYGTAERRIRAALARVGGA